MELTDRCAVVDGRLWLCDPEDPSLTYSAARNEVTLHRHGRSEVVGDDIWTELGEHLGDDPWVGWFGYASRPDLPATVNDDRDTIPDAVWMRPGRCVGLDSSSLRSSGSTSGGDVGRADRERSEQVVSKPTQSYRDAFAHVQTALRAGHTYEANLTYRLDARSPLEPWQVFERLSASNPAPYAGFVQHDVPGARGWLVSSSPEKYATVRDGWLESKPIKGTTPRDPDPLTDAANAERLRTDPKFRSENLMIVDLLRNDLAMACEPGTVEVPALMQVESYPSVHQLVTTIRGRLRSDITPLAAVHALFPAGSMTGAPKRRTMEIIAGVEESPRGVYSGAFGWLNSTGADLGVIIRSLTTTGDDVWTLGTGGGLTVRSDLAEEWSETRWKADRLLRVLDA